MEEILEGFIQESKELVSEMTEILEVVESSPDKCPKLEDYGQRVDRIMGSASVILEEHKSQLLSNILVYSQLCKLIGYKCSQLDGRSELAQITVAFLLDATEMLDEFIDSLGIDPEPDVKSFLTNTYKSRLEMIASKFDSNLRSTVGTDGKAVQSQIDDLFAKLT
jgi:hypothetical protein